MAHRLPAHRAAGGSRWRSLAGWAVALLLLPFLVGIDSCLLPMKTPVGDPERGWADPRISGVWLTGIKDKQPADFSAWIWVFEPYDPRTWFVTWAWFDDTGEYGPPASAAGTPPSVKAPPMPAQPSASSTAPVPDPEYVDALRILESLGNERAKPNGVSVFKAWLTTLGGRRFLVLEPKLNLSPEQGFRPAGWFVFRAELDGGRLLLSQPNTSTDNLGKATTRAQAEAIIARHAADPAFTELLVTLYPVPRSVYDTAGKALGRAFGM